MEEDEMIRNLFLFYKSYRANIRAKVTLISMKDHPDNEVKPEHARKYIELMEKYCCKLPQNGMV
jgi:aminoglycoside phosphotransferase family enzyme